MAGPNDALTEKGRKRIGAVSTGICTNMEVSIDTKASDRTIVEKSKAKFRQCHYRQEDCEISLQTFVQTQAVIMWRVEGIIRRSGCDDIPGKPYVDRDSGIQARQVGPDCGIALKGISILRLSCQKRFV